MKYKSALFIITGVLLPSLGFSLGIRVADQDAEATARGNAFVATADNPSAIYYNPAGMSLLEGQNFQVGGYGIALKSEFTSTTGVTAETKNKLLGVPQIYYTAAIPTTPFAVGVGVYSPYGLSLEWPDNSPFRTQAKAGSISYLTVNPALSWRWTKEFSVGFGLTFNYAETELSRGVVVPGDEFKFRGSGTALGFKAGALWQPTPQHSFGISYNSGTDVNFGGHSSVGTPGFAPFVPALSSRDDAKAKFHFPQFLIVGYSFRPTPDWNIEFDADWTDWDSLNDVTLKQPTSPLGNVTLPFNWKSSWFYELGVTRYFANGYRASAGYIYSENSVPDGSFLPSVPDSNRHIFSVGVGRKFRSFNWNLTYQLAYGPSRDIALGGSADGRYEFLSHALSFSLGYSF